MTPSPSKPCRLCGRTLPRDDFYKHHAMADGTLNDCKPCVRARVRKHRESNIDRVRALDSERAKAPARVALATINTRRWRKENPERLAAHTAVAYALRTGALVRLPCEVCGATRVHAHHDDYSNKLGVRWLCAAHHHQHHAKERSKT